jgi:hypothetical protein
MLVQLYMYSTYIVQAGMIICQANHAGPALHVQYLQSTDRHKCLSGKLCWSRSTQYLHWTGRHERSQGKLCWSSASYIHHTGRHKRLSSKLCLSSPTCSYIVQLDLNVQQANYACLALHVCTPYRQVRISVRQIMLVQPYMLGYHTDRLNACKTNYACPALHVCTPYRQARMPVRQIMLVQPYIYVHHTSVGMYWKYQSWSPPWSFEKNRNQILSNF